MTATDTATKDACENCGAEGPLAPTPHGPHCRPCYDKVMPVDEGE
ncbi:hypothetical protein [Pseudomonas putida]|nr:hypothetical protein [Pseudomonas putida]